MGNDMFNDEQLADAKVRADAEILHHGYPCPMTDEQITEALWKLGGYSPEGCAVQQTVSFLRLALATATRERKAVLDDLGTALRDLATATKEAEAYRAERDAAVARLGKPPDTCDRCQSNVSGDGYFALCLACYEPSAPLRLEPEEFVDKVRASYTVRVRALLAKAPPPADAATEAVREAAERLAYTLTPPINSTDDGLVMVNVEDARVILSALAARRGA